MSPRVGLPIPGPLYRGRFVARPSQFIVHVDLDGRLIEAHLADPGRLRELLVEGAPIMLRPATGGQRRTQWSAVMVENLPAGWISLDTLLANRLISEALTAEALEELADRRLVKRESRHGRSRFDFLLSSPDRKDLLLEVKSVTLAEDRVGLFPDAPSARGARHLEHLGDLTASGELDAAVLFVAQRADIDVVRAAERIDPKFAGALRRASARGVKLLARRALLGPEAIHLGPRLPVE